MSRRSLVFCLLMVFPILILIAKVLDVPSDHTNKGNVIRKHYDKHGQRDMISDNTQTNDQSQQYQDSERPSSITVHRLLHQTIHGDVSHERKGRNDPDNSLGNIPIIYVITPTYYRSTQYPDLVRMSNTLKHVPRLTWILVEDGTSTNKEIHELLQDSNISHIYFSINRQTQFNWLKGAYQRNAGIDWIRRHHTPGTPGVVYFGDDDNTYSLDLFDEIRYTKKLSAWAVGLSGAVVKEFPVVINGKVVGFSAWAAKFRRFPVDMAGFALNVNVFFVYPNMAFLFRARPGYQESAFLQQCCKRDEIEPKGNNGTKVLAWHTRDVIKKYPEKIVWRQLVESETKKSERIKKKYLKRNVHKNKKYRNKKPNHKWSKHRKKRKEF